VVIERILLVRHGQTDWNLQGRWQGFEPTALNAEGWTQARTLAKSMQARPVGMIVSSDLPRAFETASAIGDALGIQPILDERLREFNMGIFQGFTRDEMPQKFPDEWQGFQTDYWGYHIPGGESRRIMQDRMFAIWNDLLASAVGPEVIIVSHGGSLKMLLLKLFPDMPDLEAVHLGNTSVTTLEHIHERWHLATIASVDHLAVPSGTAGGEADL
jgi:broad specificity phosphatase PhoE